MHVNIRVNETIFWCVLFRTWPQKEFDHNFNELYVDSDNGNNFQRIG